MADLIKPGQIFAGRYRVERFVAKGGFGVVYAAEQIETEARVALKILSPNVIESSEEFEQLVHEARLCTRIGSEHVARIFDVGSDAETGRPFLVMELLEGWPLDQVSQSQGPLPVEDVVEYFRQIGCALDKAHAYRGRDGNVRPIVHRDLKPENLFLTRYENGAPLVKVLDFGLAKLVSESGVISGQLKGTPLFMAYEQATTEAVTPQTDIWALGLIAFYLLTGKHYWIAGSSEDFHYPRLLTELLTGPLERATVRAERLGANAALPLAFDDWFAQCVNRDPRARFATAGECAAALAAALSQGDGVADNRLPPAYGEGVARTAASLDSSDLTYSTQAVALARNRRAKWNVLVVAILVAAMGLIAVATTNRREAASANPRMGSGPPPPAGVATPPTPRVSAPLQPGAVPFTESASATPSTTKPPKTRVQRSANFVETADSVYGER